MKKKLLLSFNALLRCIAAVTLFPCNDLWQLYHRHCEPKARQSNAPNCHKLQPAFSLIELLISLIIISVIAASFAPIIAKKVNNGKIGVSANKVKTDCPVDPYGQNCKICDSSKCLLRMCTTKCAGNQYHDANCNCQPCTNHGAQCKTCTENTCTSSYCTNTCAGGEYRDDADNCSCKSCISLHGSNCKTCSKLSCTASYCTTSCAGNQYRDESDCSCKDCSIHGEKCIACSKTACLKEEQDAACPGNCKECDSNGLCTSCKDEVDKVIRGRCVSPSTVMNQSDCDKVTNYSSIYIPNDVNNPNAGGFCVHRRNAGDYDGPSISSPFISTAGPSTAEKDACQSNLCCYIGAEGRSDIEPQRTTPNNSDGAALCTSRNASDDLVHIPGVGEADYGACYRTVCNWNAAAYICERYSVGLSEAGDWSLPTKTQLEAIKAAIDNGPAKKDSASSSYKLAVQKFSGSSGMQLCAHSGTASSTGSHRCDSKNNVCNFVTTTNAAGSSTGTKAVTKAACRPSYLWGISDGKIDCASGGSCTTKVCTSWSSDCKFWCDKKPCCGGGWTSSPASYFTLACNSSCSAAKVGYPYTNYKQRICLAYGEAPSSVPILTLTGDNKAKTTTVAVSTSSSQSQETASVRCVISQYYTDK